MIRPALPTDAPTICRLLRELARYEHLEHEFVATEEAFREHLFGKHPRAEVLLAVNDEAKVVGLALFFVTFSTFLCRPGLYLEDLFVLEDHRRKGWGHALLSAVGRVAVARGCGRLEWAVLRWNKPALDFYDSLGAARQSEWVTCRLAGDALARLASMQNPKNERMQ